VRYTESTVKLTVLKGSERCPGGCPESRAHAREAWQDRTHRLDSLGATFWDTSDDYGTHPHVARALREVGRDQVVGATKTYASTATGARRSVTKALRELGVGTVDIFLLHAVDSAGELEAKLPALEALVKAKAEGLVRAVGVSSHSREVLERMLERPEVDVALVVVNETGSWMKDASPIEMTKAVKRLYRSGRGIYGMKALGSGEVTGKTEVAAALRYAFRYPYTHATCVGITTEAELEADVAIWRQARQDSRRSRRPSSDRIS
jgi:aryl-alcohol dehydrogenase-like predicted oxidoreductase